MRHERRAAGVTASATVTNEPTEPGEKAARTAGRQRTGDDVRGCGTQMSPQGKCLLLPRCGAEPWLTDSSNYRKTVTAWQRSAKVGLWGCRAHDRAHAGEPGGGAAVERWVRRRTAGAPRCRSCLPRCGRDPAPGAEPPPPSRMPSQAGDRASAVRAARPVPVGTGARSELRSSARVRAPRRSAVAVLAPTALTVILSGFRNRSAGRMAPACGRVTRLRHRDCDRYRKAASAGTKVGSAAPACAAEATCRPLDHGR